MDDKYVEFIIKKRLSRIINNKDYYEVTNQDIEAIANSIDSLKLVIIKMVLVNNDITLDIDDSIFFNNKKSVNVFYKYST